ncbi:MAG TPA: hypothetical protein VF168_00150 [Trueperaceae bacterium]
MNAFAQVMRAELFKAKRKRRTYVVSGLLWLLLPAIMLLIGQVLEANLSGSFIDEADVVKTLVSELASPFGIARAGLVGPALLSPTYYIIAIALFAGFLVGEEKSHNMWKTVLTAQPNRWAVLVGKLFVAMLLLGILLAGALISGVVLGSVGTLFLETDFSGEWAGLVRLYILQWVYSGAAVIFAFLMIFLVRNVSLGMVLVFFVPALLEGIYSIYRATIGIRPLDRFNAVFQALQLQTVLDNLPRYFFTSNLYAPARRPLLELLPVLIDEPMPQAPPDLGPFATLLRSDLTLAHSGLVMLGYAAVFFVVLAWLFTRRDVG